MPTLCSLETCEFWKSVKSAFMSPSLCSTVQSSHSIDSADMDPSQVALQVQGRRIHHQEEQLCVLHQKLPETSAAAPPAPEIQAPSTVSTGIPPAPVHLSSIHFSVLHFDFQTGSSPSDQAKIAFMISHLYGCAEKCATAEWDRRSAVFDSLPLFIQTFLQVFQSISPGREAAGSPVTLRQGKE